MFYFWSSRACYCSSIRAKRLLGAWLYHLLLGHSPHLSWVIPGRSQTGQAFLIIHLILFERMLSRWSLPMAFCMAWQSNLVLVPLSVLPAAWFPEKRGLVIGIVMGAYGFSALIITPLQTWLINPGRFKQLIWRLIYNISIFRQYRTSKNYNALPWMQQQQHI